MVEDRRQYSIYKDIKFVYSIRNDYYNIYSYINEMYWFILFIYILTYIQYGIIQHNKTSYPHVAIYIYTLENI